jgi:hypothetical protein
MSTGGSPARGAWPHLKLVSSSLAPVRRPAILEDWRRIAAAVVACTQDLARHLLAQRWGNVDEAMHERRELLTMLSRMRLDSDGRRCLVSLEQAIDESERTIAAMMGTARRD